jgi:hypothetical protein
MPKLLILLQSSPRTSNWPWEKHTKLPHSFTIVFEVCEVSFANAKLTTRRWEQCRTKRAHNTPRDCFRAATFQCRFSGAIRKAQMTTIHSHHKVIFYSRTHCRVEIERSLARRERAPSLSCHRRVVLKVLCARRPSCAARAVVCVCMCTQRKYRRRAHFYIIYTHTDTCDRT